MSCLVDVVTLTCLVDVVTLPHVHLNTHFVHTLLHTGIDGQEVMQRRHTEGMAALESEHESARKTQLAKHDRLLLEAVQEGAAGKAEAVARLKSEHFLALQASHAAAAGAQAEVVRVQAQLERARESVVVELQQTARSDLDHLKKVGRVWRVCEYV